MPRRSSNKAAALIIVLAFVVLLTGLSVAYLSRATTDRQLAHTSFHDTDADLLARSALDIVIGDFKQEIVNGSTFHQSLAKPSLSRRHRLMLCRLRSGNPAPPGAETSDPIPNLIRRSVYPDAIDRESRHRQSRLRSELHDEPLQTGDLLVWPSGIVII